MSPVSGRDSRAFCSRTEHVLPHFGCLPWALACWSKSFSPACLFSVVVLDCSGRRPSFENPELPLLPRKALILMNLRRWNQKLSVKSVSRSGIRAEVEQLYPLLSGNKSRQKQVVNYGAIE